VYNLCSERNYDPVLFDGRVEYFPFDDHNAPYMSQQSTKQDSQTLFFFFFFFKRPLQMIYDCCESMQAWLDSGEGHVAVIHCKAGKGRTGVMICCWMLFSGMWPDAEASLEFYGAMRTSNRQGVTIPSQRRYVRYFGDAMRRLRLVEQRGAADANAAAAAKKPKTRPALPPKDPAIAAQFAADMAASEPCMTCGSMTLNRRSHDVDADNGIPSAIECGVCEKKRQEKINATLSAFLAPPGVCEHCNVAPTTDDSTLCQQCIDNGVKPSAAAAAPAASSSSSSTTTTTTNAATTSTSPQQLSPKAQRARNATAFAAPTLDLKRRRELWLEYVYVLEPLELKSVTLSPAPIGVAMRDLRFTVAKNKNTLLTWQPEDAEGLGDGAQRVDLDCGGVRVAGDIKVNFFVREQKNKLLHFWFNTSFVRSAKLVLYQADIDDAAKDKGKTFAPGFLIELRFHAKSSAVGGANAAAAAAAAAAVSSSGTGGDESQPATDSLVEDPNLTLNRGGAMSPRRLAALSAGPAPVRRASGASAVALAGRAVPLTGVAGEVLLEGALHVLSMRQNGVVARAPPPPGVQASTEDEDDASLTKARSAHRASIGLSLSPKLEDSKKARASAVLSASTPNALKRESLNSSAANAAAAAAAASESSVGVTARKLEAQTRHWCVIDDNSGFGARLSIGVVDAKKKDGNARHFKARGSLYVRDAAVELVGRQLRVVAASVDDDADDDSIEMLTLAAEDELDAAQWRDCLLENGAVPMMGDDDDDDDDDHAAAAATTAVASSAASSSTSGVNAAAALAKPSTPAPAPSQGTSSSLKKAKSKKRREKCHKCNTRRVAARVFVDGLHVLLCRECTLDAMHSYNTKHDAGGVVDDNDNE
jgi:hypothetical protein